MGYSSILCMQAGMTFEPKDMEMAAAALQDALATCQRCALTVCLMFYCTYGHSVTLFLTSCPMFQVQTKGYFCWSHLQHGLQTGPTADDRRSLHYHQLPDLFPIYFLFDLFCCFLCIFIILNLTFASHRRDTCWTVLCRGSTPKSRINFFRGTILHISLLSILFELFLRFPHVTYFGFKNVQCTVN